MDVFLDQTCEKLTVTQSSEFMVKKNYKKFLQKDYHLPNSDLSQYLQVKHYVSITAYLLGRDIRYLRHLNPNAKKTHMPQNQLPLSMALCSLNVFQSSLK